MWKCDEEWPDDWSQELIDAIIEYDNKCRKAYSYAIRHPIKFIRWKLKNLYNI